MKMEQPNFELFRKLFVISVMPQYFSGLKLNFHGSSKQF